MNKMGTSFLYMANMSGIVCGSDTDMTIFQLSKKSIVVLAVSATSSIPWFRIIEDYRKKGEPQYYQNFEGYINDFEKYLSTVEVDFDLKTLDIDDCNLLFMGYNENDIYPIIYNVYAGIDETSKRICFEEVDACEISHDINTSSGYIGNFDQVSTLFQGATSQMFGFVEDRAKEFIDEYISRVFDKFAGTKYEDKVKEYFEKNNTEYLSQIIAQEAGIFVFNRLDIGLDAFSIEDMVGAVETIIDANIRLNHIYSGGKNPLGHTQELAVITRAEGLKWIKHSLFAI